MEKKLDPGILTLSKLCQIKTTIFDQKAKKKPKQQHERQRQTREMGTIIHKPSHRHTIHEGNQMQFTGSKCHIISNFLQIQFF